MLIKHLYYIHLVDEVLVLVRSELELRLRPGDLTHLEEHDADRVVPHRVVGDHGREALVEIERFLVLLLALAHPAEAVERGDVLLVGGEHLVVERRGAVALYPRSNRPVYEALEERKGDCRGFERSEIPTQLKQ